MITNVYAKMKIFHFKSQLDLLTKDKNKIVSPIHVRIKPTNLCNHNCWYCSYRMPKLQLGKNMKTTDYIPKQKIVEIICDLKEMGVKAVTFSGGGEPFCYPYFIEAINKLVQVGIPFASLTNGVKLDGKIAEIFADYGSWLRVSMDGFNDRSYARSRNVPQGEFTRVMENIKRFKKMRSKCRIGVSLIIDASSVLHVYSFIKKMKDIGIDNVKLSPCIVSDHAADNIEYYKNIYGRLRREFEKAMTTLRDDNFEIFDSFYGLNETFEKDYFWCPYIQILPVIGADLNVYSCQDKAYNCRAGLIGSIKKKRFKDFWFNGKSKFFKINPHLHCKHHCVANSKNKLILEYLNVDRKHMAFV